MDTLTLTQPDDWHIHLRDGAALETTVPDCASQFARAIVMPNLQPPVSNVKLALEYRDRILAAVPAGLNFTPLMTLYLTPDTTKADIEAAVENPHIYAVKLYPAGATTHSSQGVDNIQALYPIFDVMQRVDLPLLIHGEVTDEDVDIFDREAVFIDRFLAPLQNSFPELRTVLEHITTRHAVDFVTDADPYLAATITAHHLHINRNDMLAGGIRPHHYCLPVAKRAEHQQALQQAAISGSNKFFLGTDSAPHSRHNKEAVCGCAGIYTAHHAIELYADIFDQLNALDKLEGFASFFGADFYGLEHNKKKITLQRKPHTVEDSLTFGDDELIPWKSVV